MKSEIRVTLKHKETHSLYSCTVYADDINEAFKLALEHARNNVLFINQGWELYEVEEDFT